MKTQIFSSISLGFLRERKCRDGEEQERERDLSLLLLRRANERDERSRSLKPYFALYTCHFVRVPSYLSFFTKPPQFHVHSSFDPLFLLFLYLFSNYNFFLFEKMPNCIYKLGVTYINRSFEVFFFFQFILLLLDTTKLPFEFDKLISILSIAQYIDKKIE